MDRIDYSRFDGTPFERPLVRDHRFVVAGAGALGNEVCRLLGMIGVGEVLVVDFDTVEPTNASRSMFLRAETDVGKPKAEVLAAAAGEVFPDTAFRSAVCEIADVGYGDMAGFSALFGCLDTQTARSEASIIAGHLGIPFVDGGLGLDGYHTGRVAVFRSADGACFNCTLSPATRARVIGGLFRDHPPCADPGPDLGPRSSTPALCSVVAALQVHHAVTVLQSGLTRGSFVQEVRLDQGQVAEVIRVTRDPSCMLHEFPGQRLEPVVGSTFQDLLVRWAARSVCLDWPICTLALCARCGHRWNPLRRVAWLRVRGCCPLCLSGPVVVCRSALSIGPGSPWLGARVAEFGLPANHLLRLT